MYLCILTTLGATWVWVWIMTGHLKLISFTASSHPIQHFQRFEVFGSHLKIKVMWVSLICRTRVAHLTLPLSANLSTRWWQGCRQVRIQIGIVTIRTISVEKKMMIVVTMKMKLSDPRFIIGSRWQCRLGARKNISNIIKSISAANMSKQEVSVLNKLFVYVRVRWIRW